MRFLHRSSIIFVLLIGLDQITKQLVVWYSSQLSHIRLGPLVGVVPFRNYHFAFSLPVPIWAMYAFYGLILSTMLFYLYTSWQNLHLYQKQAWLLVLAGAISNIGERIILGYVNDFIYIYGGAIINIADIYILTGLICLLLYDIFANQKKN